MPGQCERRMDVGSAMFRPMHRSASECIGRLTMALLRLSVRSAWFASVIVNVDQDFYSGFFDLKY